MLQKKRIRNHILQTFTSSHHHLLHSDKSTYFYNKHNSNGSNNAKQRKQDSFLSADHFPNDIGWTSPHCERNASSSDDSHANRTRSSLLKMSHRKMVQPTSILHRSTYSTMPLVLCSFALLGLGIGLMNPIGNSNGEVHATTVTDNPAPYASIAFSLANSSNEELNDGDTVSSEVMPGLVNYIDTYINIRTSKINQYYVGVQAATDGTSALTNATTSTTINPVAANTKPDSFANNTWGYALGETSTMDSELSYNPLPAYSTNTPVQYTSPSNLTDGSYQLKLTFAAKINANQPAGHYTTKAIVSVAADAKSLPTLSDITYMQEMTSDICNATPAPTAEDIENKTYDEIIANTPSKQLKDTRDNKYYWVSKLADGNCWMTQNLDFDIPDTLSSNTSDVIGTDVITGITNGSTAIADWTNDNTIARYHDPGDYYYNGPNGDHSQDTTNSCTDITDGLSNSKCSLFTTTGDAHYHVGNYYNWLGATVSSGKDLTNRGDQAPDSICPKGWQLPVSGIDTNNVLLANDKTFAKLFEAYGWSWNKGYYTDTLNGGTNYYIYNTPFYFVYSGNLYSSSLRSAGSNGYYWSSTAISDATAYSLMLRSNAVPAGNSGRYSGYSVRCVAR